MMARRFESGFHLVERCKRELPALAIMFPADSAMRASLNEMVTAAATADGLLRQAGGTGQATGSTPCKPTDHA
jgi:hypothetical protein